MGKNIFYIWFGKTKKNKLQKKCISSWKKYLPEYNIIEINESNFNVNCNKYCSIAYSEHLYSFVSDYARLKVIYDNGGLYFDTDVELFKRPDSRILKSSFFSKSYNNNEMRGNINTGLGFQCEKGEKLLEHLMRDYNLWNGTTHKKNKIIITPSCTEMNKHVFNEYGVTNEDITEKIGKIIFLSSDYLDSYNVRIKLNNFSKNSFGIHHYSHFNVPKIDTWYEYELLRYKSNGLSYEEAVKKLKRRHIIKYIRYWFHHNYQRHEKNPK